jgi:hypothetical protein
MNKIQAGESGLRVAVTVIGGKANRCCDPV